MRCDLPHLQNCAKYAINGSNLFSDMVKEKKFKQLADKCLLCLRITFINFYYT